MAKNNKRDIILKISKNYSIYADNYQYILTKGSHDEGYFGTLEECFLDMFKLEVKNALRENTKKDLQTVIEIHKKIRDDLMKFFKDIENPSVRK